jgi:hypothetical protein
MFPYVEKKRRVDDYGETIDVGMWLRKGKALEEEAESEDIKDYKRRVLAEEDAKVYSLLDILKTSKFRLECYQGTSFKVCYKCDRDPTGLSPAIR